MQVKERFLRYVAINTRSNEASETCPSTEGQRRLAALLAEEMKEMGLSDVSVDENGYVFGYLPATKGMEDRPTLGFLAHMDTSPDASGENIRPQTIRYEGGDILLQNGEKVETALFPSLARYIGQELIVTDGTTLLGADDKAGIAEIMTAVERLQQDPAIPHGRIAVGFTPDEEIGRGADRFDVQAFGATVAYTVDGAELGEIEYENFNAASATLTVKGVNIHPGEAKGRMKNALLMATEWVSRLPVAETPSHTEGYEGFYHVTDLCGDVTRATVSLLIRDHNRDAFERRKTFLQGLTAYENTVWGEGSFTISIADSYYNMKEQILPHMELIENAERAMREAGVEPRIVPIRGGTDGARLSYMGLPCPNLSTGGVNFHGVHEFISVESMERMTQVLVNLMKG